MTRPTLQDKCTWPLRTCYARPHRQDRAETLKRRGARRAWRAPRERLSGDNLLVVLLLLALAELILDALDLVLVHLEDHGRLELAVVELAQRLGGQDLRLLAGLEVLPLHLQVGGDLVLLVLVLHFDRQLAVGELDERALHLLGEDGAEGDDDGHERGSELPDHECPLLVVMKSHPAWGRPGPGWRVSKRRLGRTWAVAPPLH